VSDTSDAFSSSTNTPKVVVFTVTVYDSVFLFSFVLDPWQPGFYLYPTDVAVDKIITSPLLFMLTEVLPPQHSTPVNTSSTSGSSSMEFLSSEFFLLCLYLVADVPQSTMPGSLLSLLTHSHWFV